MNVEKLYAQASKEYNAKKYVAALKTIDRIKKIAPRYRNAYYLEAGIWNDRKNIVREYYALEKILPLLNTSTPEGKKFTINVFLKIAEVCKNLALIERACKYYYLAATLTDNEEYLCTALDATLLTANCSELFTSVDFHAVYDEYKKILKNIEPFPKKFYDHQKIRVGFLSADFRNHALIFWAWALLTQLNRKVFDVYLYSNVQEPDEITERLRNSQVFWRDITKLTDEEAAKLIREDEIDILFDLNGHTSDVRYRIEAYRPASVQMSGIGYMNSTGLDCLDFFLSDIYLTGNLNVTSEYFTEKVLRLPQTHIRYSPRKNTIPAAAESPCYKNGYVTFGTFNQHRKITDTMLCVWKEILDAVPNSRLFLKAKLFDNKDGCKFFVERLKKADIDPARVEMRGFTANHLAEYADMDIALDTFPYTGGVTTCEALYMGVPVISLYGGRPGSRFGLSILSNVGLGELAVDSYEEYITRAVALANDWELLTILRKNLRGMMEKSPLMDSKNYILNIERVFLAILDAERKNN